MKLRLAFSLSLVLLFAQAVASVQAQEFTAKVTDEPIAPDGTPIQCDLPKDLHMRNTGGIGPRGPGTGAGLCVFTSNEMACEWANEWRLYGFQEWMKHRPGGGTPPKLDAMIAQFCKEKGWGVPDYVQGQEGSLDTVKKILATGRMVSITYCQSPSGRYGGRTIPHMVSLLHLDDKWACVLDNNFPGTYEWMTPADLSRVSRCGGGNLWWVAFCAPCPPPPPSN